LLRKVSLTSDTVELWIELPTYRAPPWIAASPANVLLEIEADAGSGYRYTPPPPFPPESELNRVRSIVTIGYGALVPSTATAPPHEADPALSAMNASSSSVRSEFVSIAPPLWLFVVLCPPVSVRPVIVSAIPVPAAKIRLA
jgi:hypothetical protein